MNTRYVISDSLNSMGMTILANDAIKQLDHVILNNYVSILEKAAIQNKRHDIIERLCFAGLIYG